MTMGSQHWQRSEQNEVVSGLAQQYWKLMGHPMSVPSR